MNRLYGPGLESRLGRMGKHKKQARPAITKETADAFFLALDANEEVMPESAALAVTLEQFGYGNWENDVLAEMAEAAEWERIQ